MSSHQKVRRATVDWSNPPPGILSAIEKRLESRIDIIRCRSVCQNWRASIKPNHNSSILSSILPRKISNSSSLPFNNRTNETLILSARSVLLVKPLSSPNCDDDGSFFRSWVVTVEEVEQGKLRILYPLSNKYVTNLPSSFPKYLDLCKFNVTEIAKTYKLKYASDGSDVNGVIRVVLCSNFTAMVLYGKGTLVEFKLKTGKWDYIRDSLLMSISDVVICKGIVYAVTCNGGCCSVDRKTLKWKNYVGLRDHRKCLVVHKDELYFVAWNSSKFSVFSLEKQNNRWVEINGGTEVLFVGVDCCFLAKIGVCSSAIVCSKDCIDSLDCRRPFDDSNTVVCSNDCIDSLGGGRTSKVKWMFDCSSLDLEIAYIEWPEGVYSDFSAGMDMIAIGEALWPPPTWFWNVTYSSDGEEEEDNTLEYSNQEVKNHQQVLHPSSSAVDSSFATASFCNEQGLVQKANMITMDSVVVEGFCASELQNSNSCTSTVIFEGVKIQSNLLPTLQTIWAKQGNVLEESGIRNGDLLAKALESLATAFLILKNSSGRSLTKIQAEYLSSTLCDLQYMRFKVDWLTPFVETALAVYKSKVDLESVDLEQSLGKGLC